MGYELPATLGVRLAQGDDGEVIALIGDGTFLMQPTELATAAQEGLKVTVVVSDNHGYQVIRRLQMHATGRHFGNEMRYRVGSLGAGPLEGDYVRLDLVSVARGLGATVFAAGTRDEVLDALARARETDGPVVIVVPTAPHVNLPASGVWWDVAPAAVSVTAVAGGEARGLPGRPRDPAVARMTLRDRLRAGEPTLGTFLNLGSPLAAEACALAGFDWLLIDLEHGAGEDALVGQLLAAAAHGVPALVRVESAERIRAGRALDAGAAGVMFPRMDTTEQVQAALAHLRYPPEGDRGVATYNRACGFGLRTGALDSANDEVIGVIQIESVAAVEHVEAIAAQPGVDVLFVGPRDLTHALGVPGRIDAPEYRAALQRVLAATQRGRRDGRRAGREPRGRRGLRRRRASASSASARTRASWRPPRARRPPN